MFLRTLLNLQDLVPVQSHRGNEVLPTNQWRASIWRVDTYRIPLILPILLIIIRSAKIHTEILQNVSKIMMERNTSAKCLFKQFDCRHLGRTPRLL